MHERIALTLRISSALLVLSGYLALASVTEIGVPILAIPLITLVLAPLGERLDAASALYRMVSKAFTIAVICFLPYTFLALGLLYTVIAVIIYIQVYTLLHRRTERNYYHLYLMAFFLVLAACAGSPEPVIGLVLLLFLQSAIWAFLCLRLHVESLAHSGDQHPEIVPLLQTRANLVPDQPNLFNRGLVFAVTTVSFAAIILTILGFRFTPRAEAGLLGNSENSVSRTGLSESVSIRGDEFIQEDETPVMHVRFPDAPGGWYGEGNGLYWRVTTLNFYENSEWNRRPVLDPLEPGISHLYHFEGAEEVPERSAIRLQREHRPQYPLVRQEIYLDRAPDNGLPGLDLVQALEVNVVSKESKVAWDANRDFTVVYATQGPRRLTYDLWSEVRRANPERLRAITEPYEETVSRRDLRLLTSHDLLPETQALAEEITRGQTTYYDKVLALQRWLSGQDFEYSLEVPPLPDANPIDAFIQVRRVGHCQLFATALALMTRSVGIPARVVNGYRGGEWNTGDQAYTIRASMAHLWVEVYFPGEGWVVFDPSPRSDEESPGNMALLSRAVSSLALRSKIYWYREVVGFESGLQFSQLRDRSIAFIRSPFQAERFEGEEFTAGNGLRNASLIIVCLAGGVLFTVILWRATRHTRGRVRKSWTPDQVRAVRLYRRLLSRLERSGIACQGKTVEEIATDVAAGALPGSDTVLEVLGVYNAARFGAAGLSEGEYRQHLSAVKALGQR